MWIVSDFEVIVAELLPSRKTEIVVNNSIQFVQRYFCARKKSENNPLTTNYIVI